MVIGRFIEGKSLFKNKNMNNQTMISNIASMERRPEKSAGVLRPFCGQLALIFLDLLFRFVSRQNEYV
jgi:hypothetical protein